MRLIVSRRAAGVAILAVVVGCATVSAPATEARPAPTAYPTTPPARICGNSTILGHGPTAPPAGALVVPAGDNSTFDFGQPNLTYWYAPGRHTLGTNEFSQIAPGTGSTHVGAPGAVLDGLGVNRYAFTSKGTNVTIRYLTITGFNAPLDEGVVNHDAGSDWTIEYSTVTQNHGAGLMAGSGNVYRYNCITQNGQYGINACCGGPSAEAEIHHWTLDHNEIAGNNTDDWEHVLPNGCGCTGGIKFWLNRDVTVTNNYVHDNHGPGFWLDNNNRLFVIEHNYLSDNEGQGVFDEAGYDARIRFNNFLRNAIVEGRVFAARGDFFPTTAVYISEAGAPEGYGLNSPMLISDNNFENNWGGVALWENADRYSGSSAHTHVSGTIKIGSLYNDDACNGPDDTIPATVDDKYKCRWSTENISVEHNRFVIDKAAIGSGCAGADFCGISGIFANTGSYPEFSGFEIPGRITFMQNNHFRNNQYFGDWKFAGFERTTPDRGRVTWQNWTAPAAPLPPEFTVDNRPETFGQDEGSTYSLSLPKVKGKKARPKRRWLRIPPGGA
jgi:parallel beta-helix repeat protein